MAEDAGAILTIDLDALVANWRYLATHTTARQAAAVVKADAYGLGAAQVVPALVVAGCRLFFVAHLAEALAIRPLLPDGAQVAVLNGLMPSAEPACAAANVLPVLNSPDQARRWQAHAQALGRPLPAMLQLDIGMARLGLSLDQAGAMAADSAFAQMVPLQAVLGHLACADDPADPANAAQLAAFRAGAVLFPGVPRSLANSAASLNDARFHGDILRPGLALYGAQPVTDARHPIRPVISLQARVIQTRDVIDGTGAGYGLTWRADGPRRLATLAVGYADGWPRSLSERGAAWWNGHDLPIAGRVSMDSTIIDITALPLEALRAGDLVELIGPHRPIEQVAAQAGTIAYEILTGLGHRYTRRYLPLAVPNPQEIAA
ncbi:alanine racemase [Novosphingobium ovatum]|nr:alanine racemase [Novosphingobium ovatum]